VIRRHIVSELQSALADTPVVMLTGPRQSGKSTLVQALARERTGAIYRTLDDALTLVAARDDPVGFVAEGGSPSVIDEVQRAPELLLEIKASVDRDRRPGRFVVTGSADVLSLPKVADSLAGRMEVLRLWPLSQGEIEGSRERFLDALLAGDPASLARDAPALSKDELLGKVARGGFPEALGRTGTRRERWFESYLDTVLHREVRDLSSITGLAELHRLMLLLAARGTGLVNVAGIGRDLGVPQTTLKRQLALLEATFLIRLVPAWYRNVGQRLVKAPKLALVDAGLMSHLLGSARGQHVGPLVESFVLMELLKQASFSDARPRLHHYRTAAGVEVDALLEVRGGRVAGVEVKAAATVKPADLRGLRTLAERLGDDFVAGVVLHTGPDSARLGERIWALPLGALWSGGS